MDGARTIWSCSVSIPSFILLYAYVHEPRISNVQGTGHDQGFVINNELPYNKVEY